jgi:hypothetical protein
MLRAGAAGSVLGLRVGFRLSRDVGCGDELTRGFVLEAAGGDEVG